MFFWNNYRRKIEYKFLSDYLSSVNGGSVLDIGCGDGALTNMLLGDKDKICGVDYSKESIKVGHKKNLNIDFIISDAHHLPFKDAIFDIVISNCALEHFQNGEAVLKEAGRLLISGGILAFTTEVDSEILSDEQRRKRKELTYTEEYYSYEILKEKMDGFKIIDYTYYLSGFACKLNIFIQQTKFPKVINIGVGAPLHKLFSPLLYFISKGRSLDRRKSLGIAVKAKKLEDIVIKRELI